MTPEARFSATPRAEAALRRRAVQTQHAVGHRAKATRGDRSPTRVARAVGPLVELGQSSLDATQLALKRLADADVGQATHRFGGSVADPLPKSDHAAALRALGEHPQSLSVTVSPSLQLSANRVEVKIS
jgi:hypothetical protein